MTAVATRVFTLSTELPFGRPEVPPELQAAFAELPVERVWGEWEKWAGPN